MNGGRAVGGFIVGELDIAHAEMSTFFGVHILMSTTPKIVESRQPEGFCGWAFFLKVGTPVSNHAGRYARAPSRSRHPRNMRTIAVHYSVVHYK